MTDFITIIILEFVIVLIFSFILATLAHFLDYCFREGEIFGRWLCFLQRNMEGTRLEPLINTLGGCVICMTGGLAVLSFSGLLFLSVHWLWFLPYIVLSSFFTRLIDKLLN